jgi:hypothetical protein
MKRTLGSGLAAAVGAACLAATAWSAEPAVDHKAAFDRMKTLVGSWQGHHTTPDGPAMTVEYRLTGGGSALVERLFAGSPHEMTSVYYMDGSELVLTHYCAAANQPRMKLVAGGKEGDLEFDFVGGTNIDVATTTHIHGGRIAIAAPDRFDADWHFWTQGKQGGTHKLFMQRAAK